MKEFFRLVVRYKINLNAVNAMQILNLMMIETSAKEDYKLFTDGWRFWLKRMSILQICLIHPS